MALSGQKTVTTAGTAEALGSAQVSAALMIKALDTNTGTNEKLSRAYQVAVGETVTIETAYGVKTVKNGAGINLIGKLTTDSDLASFHIDHEIFLPATNTMHVTGALTAGQTAQVTFNYLERYIGI